MKVKKGSQYNRKRYGHALQIATRSYPVYEGGISNENNPAITADNRLSLKGKFEIISERIRGNKSNMFYKAFVLMIFRSKK